MMEAPDLPKPLLILIALIQGLLLLMLHISVERDGWLAHDAAWQYAAFTATIVGPTFLLLSLDTHNFYRLLRRIAPFTALAAALGYYAGSQQIPREIGGTVRVDFVYGLTMAVACFKALLYIQQSATGEPASYTQLYRFSWRNFLTQGCALVFTGLFWGILMLWAALFKVIKIDFFFTLFTDKWFLYPVLGMAHGFGIAIFRSQQKIFDLATRVNQALMKFLLAMLILVSVVFLCALPFTGLAPLWETGTGSALILWLQALVLFFLNGVYEDDDTRPYPPALHRIIFIGVALLPIYSVIAFYGLQLRIEQYGWTLERCWAMVIWVVLALFSASYMATICRFRDRWTAHLGWVNIRVGLLLMVVLLATNSPVFDFRKIAVASQLSRLESGALTLQNFDYAYFRHYLAGPGYEALHAIKHGVAKDDPGIVSKIDNLYRRYDERSTPENDVLALSRNLVVWPRDAVLPPGLLDRIASWSSWSTSSGIARTAVFVADLDGDGRDEYLVLTRVDDARVSGLFIREGDVWQNVHVVLQGEVSGESELAASIDAGDVEIVESQWKDLRIGKLRARVVR